MNILIIFLINQSIYYATGLHSASATVLQNLNVLFYLSHSAINIKQRKAANL